MRRLNKANKEEYILLLDHSCIASKNMFSSWSSISTSIRSSCVDVDEFVDNNICVKLKHNICYSR